MDSAALTNTFNNIDSRFDKIDGRLDKIEARMATKDDLKLYVTKVEFDEFKDFLRDNMVYRHDFDEFRNTILTRGEFLEHMELIDKMVEEVKSSGRSRLLYEKQYVELDDQVGNHEKRITTLEGRVRN